MWHIFCLRFNSFYVCIYYFFFVRYLVIVQIKHEPCQVSEVTTSNNFQSSRAVCLQAQTPSTHSLYQEKSDKSDRINAGRSIVKSEIKSPTETAPTASTTSLSIATSDMDHNSTNSVQSGEFGFVLIFELSNWQLTARLHSRPAQKKTIFNYLLLFVFDVCCSFLL